MKLETVMENVASETPLPAGVEISAITCDSREVTRGALFIAIPGTVTDGARFIESAVKKGAAAIIAETAFTTSVPVLQVRDAREAAARAAASFYGRPTDRLSILGVTGTSGKTTTTKMIESVLDATGSPVGLIGTIEYRAGELREIADRTTPDAVALHGWFARMADAGVKHAVMEVSSHALVLKRTEGIHFDAAVFTNLSRDHFDFHKDFEDYFRAKSLLFDQIDRSRRSAVVNIGDEHGARLASSLGDAALTFSLDGDADLHPAPGFHSGVDGLRGEVITPFGNVNLVSPLIGLPNLQNWLAAIGATLVAGIEIPVIEEGIRNLTSVRGRFERVPSPQGTLLIDYAHKPDAMEKLLRAVRDMDPAMRLVVVFGCGGDRDRGKRAIMGEIAARLADLTIITSDNPRGEDPLAIVREIEEGAARVQGAQTTTVVDRRAAIERGVAELNAGSVVIIAGKGHENYQVVADRIEHFDDREEAELAVARLDSIKASKKSESNL